MNQLTLPSLKVSESAQSNWLNIFCVGIVQASMGAVVVTTTTTLNRVMVIELGLPAVVSGFLVSLHYIIQIVRPRMGYGADQTKQCTPWILGGMGVLTLGGVLAALATTWMAANFALGLTTALIAYCMIGIGVSACGTTLLVLLSKGVGDQQRATAATSVWIMMIFGFAVTSIVSGKLLDPFSFDRLLMVSIGVSVLAMALSALSVIGLESRLLKNISSWDALKTDTPVSTQIPSERSAIDFKQTLALLWRDEQARLFTLFVFTSMFAYSAQDLILEPFAGLIYHYTPGQTTQLSGVLHASVLVGMLLLALIGSKWINGRLGQVSTWMSWGCLLSAFGMLGLSSAGLISDNFYHLPLTPILLILGVGNGLFSIAAISTMMRLATQSNKVISSNSNVIIQPGIRMGLFGAAQALAFGLGGIVGTASSDLSMHLIGDAGWAYSSVFALEAAMFICAAWIARSVQRIET